MLFGLFKKNSVRSNLYLQKHGWYKSEGYPLGIDGRSMPMLPYVVTDLLLMHRKNITSAYINSNEFSFRWSMRTFNHAFCPNVQISKNSNGRIKFVVKKSDRRQRLTEYQAQRSRAFDLIIVDGSEKLSTCQLLMEYALPRAIFLLPVDITNHADYDGARNFLKQHHFKIVDFVNPAPVIDSMGCAVCYRSDNVLDL